MSSRTEKQTSYRREENETSYIDGTREHLFTTSGGESTDAEYARMMLAKPTHYSEEEIQAALRENAPRPFRLLR